MVVFLQHRKDLYEVDNGVQQRKNDQDGGDGVCASRLRAQLLLREQRSGQEDSEEYSREGHRERKLRVGVEPVIPARVQDQRADKAAKHQPLPWLHRDQHQRRQVEQRDIQEKLKSLIYAGGKKHGRRKCTRDGEGGEYLRVLL